MEEMVIAMAQSVNLNRENSARTARVFRIILAAALVTAARATVPAVAADPATTDTDIQVAQAATSAGLATTTGAQAATPVTSPISPLTGIAAPSMLRTATPPGFLNPYALADSLRYKGWIVPLPPAIDTLDQGAFGLRNTLANDGISWFGFTSDNFTDNLIRHALPPGNQFGPHSRDLQVYSGQLPTYTSANEFGINYDLTRFGIPDGQISLGGSILETNWQPGDPNGIGIAFASYYQTFFHKLFEFKIGLLNENLEFLGIQIGGNIGAGLFGVSAAIPFEQGQTVGNFIAPAAHVKVNLPDHFYDKLGVQRATSPDGLQVERHYNPTGVRFTVPNAGVFVINEAGYQVRPAPGQMSTWIRVAGDFSSSRYTDFLTDVRHPYNWALYLLADRQLIQTAPNGGARTAYQGIYAGFTVIDSPERYNPFSQYYEVRLYSFGLIPGRPQDLINLNWNRNIFSKDFLNDERFEGSLVHFNANTYTAAYNIHIIHGTNLALGVSYTDHPSPGAYTRSTGSALNFLTNLFVWF